MIYGCDDDDASRKKNKDSGKFRNEFDDFNRFFSSQILVAL